jgi:hypothetical protein
MLFEESLPFVKDYINELNDAIKTSCPGESFPAFKDIGCHFA